MNTGGCGKALIRAFEGLRLVAYKDVAMGIDAGSIINSKTLKKTHTNYNKLIIQLNSLFNIFLWLR